MDWTDSPQGQYEIERARHEEHEEEVSELRQMVIDAYQLHDRMFRRGANLPALREWAERFHDISDISEKEVGPTAQSEIERLRAENERLRDCLRIVDRLIGMNEDCDSMQASELIGEALVPPNASHHGRREAPSGA